MPGRSTGVMSLPEVTAGVFPAILLAAAWLCSVHPRAAAAAAGRPDAGADAGRRLTRAPRITKAPVPVYPPGADGGPAVVGLLLDLDPEGHVIHAEVSEPA